MNRKIKFSRLLAVFTLITALLGTSCVPVGAATVPYRTIPQSKVPSKVGNSYVCTTQESLSYFHCGNTGILFKEGQYNIIKDMDQFVNQDETVLCGVTNGTNIYFSTDIQYKGSWIYKYSISTGKITKYKSFKDAEVLVNGYYGNKIYYNCAPYEPDFEDVDCGFFSYDTKTKKKTLISSRFQGRASYGKYLVGGDANNSIKAYNMATGKFMTLSKNVSSWDYSQLYGTYVYYSKYISKAAGGNCKYKIYKFNLNTGKSAPVSKTFEASQIGKITNKKATYYKNTQDGEEIKEYTLKY